MRNSNNSYIVEGTSNYSKVANYFFDEVPTEYGILNLLKTDIALLVYGIIIVLAIIITFVKALLFFKVAVMASENIHAKMFHSILLAPMKFFNTNPCGRILNRFSKDLGSIDELLPRMLQDAIQVSRRIPSYFTTTIIKILSY